MNLSTKVFNVQPPRITNTFGTRDDVLTNNPNTTNEHRVVITESLKQWKLDVFTNRLKILHAHALQCRNKLSTEFQDFMALFDDSNLTMGLHWTEAITCEATKAMACQIASAICTISFPIAQRSVASLVSLFIENKEAHYIRIKVALLDFYTDLQPDAPTPLPQVRLYNFANTIKSNTSKTNRM